MSDVTVMLNDDGRTLTVSAAKAFHLRRAGLAPADAKADEAYLASVTPAQRDLLMRKRQETEDEIPERIERYRKGDLR